MKTNKQPNRVRKKEKEMSRKKAKSEMICIVERVFDKRWRYKVVWKRDVGQFETWEWGRSIKNKSLIKTFIENNGN